MTFMSFFLVLNFINLLPEISCEGYPNDYESPRPSDLPIFLNTLKKITDYAINNVNAVDMNLMLGIFLTKVNLEASRSKLGDEDETALLEEVDSACGIFLHNYHLQLATHNSSDDRKALISSLFTNSTAWALELPPYATPRVLRALHRPRTPATPFRSGALTWHWDIYRAAIRQYEAWVPSPQLSDECLLTLAADVASGTGAGSLPLRLRPCRTTDACYTAVYQGTWFGYALTHRLIIIVSGLFSRHCYLHTPAADARLSRQLCARIYTETAFIAHNHYSLRDLFMEQISMCSLLGHVEFLDRSWLIQIVGWQDSGGCFQEEYQRPGDQEWNNSEMNGNTKIKQNNEIHLRHFGKNLSTNYLENVLVDHINDNKITKKDRSGKKIVKNKHNKEVKHVGNVQKVMRKCDSHVSAVAAAAISAAVRFIIQFYQSDDA